MTQKQYTVYHLPGPNYVGQTNRQEGARWASHAAAGKDVLGANTVSHATASTLNTREAYHIGANDAYHNGANLTRGNDLQAYHSV